MTPTNDARQIVIDEATELSARLQNGSSEDQHVQGRAIGLLTKMVTSMYSSNFVTVEMCENKINKTSLKFGTFAITGKTPVLMAFILGVFISMIVPIETIKSWF